MNESHIAIRYAKAMFELAKEKNILEKVYQDVVLIMDTLKKNSELKSILKSPVIPTSGKQKILFSIFEPHLAKESLNFLKVILENKRETYLESITRNFIDSYKEEKGIKTVKLTTTIVVPEDIKQQLAEVISKSLQCKTEFDEEINPNIIGGFVLRIQDLQYNASVSAQLNKIKQSLTKA